MMVMHQAPTDGGGYGGVAHFHIEGEDKLKYLAGSETGAGAYLDALPEKTAGTLRELKAPPPEPPRDRRGPWGVVARRV